MCYGNYLEGNLNYVVYGDLTVSISQEKQNNFRATLKLFIQLILLTSVEKEKRVKHWEGKECSYKLMHDQSNTTKAAENNF